MRHRQPGKGLKQWGPKWTRWARKGNAAAVDRGIERRARQHSRAECEEGLAEYEAEKAL